MRDWRPGAGMQFGACGCCFASLTVLGSIQLGLLVEVPLCEIDSRVYGACSLGVLVEVPRAREHAVWRAGDGRVLRGM